MVLRLLTIFFFFYTYLIRTAHTQISNKYNIAYHLRRARWFIWVLDRYIILCRTNAFLMDEFRCGGSGTHVLLLLLVLVTRYTQSYIRLVPGRRRRRWILCPPFNITEPVWVVCIYLNRWPRRLRGREHCVLIDCVRRTITDADTVPPARRRRGRRAYYTRVVYLVSWYNNNNYCCYYTTSSERVTERERERSIRAHQSSASSAGSHGPVRVNHSRGLLVLIYSVQVLFAVTYY